METGHLPVAMNPAEEEEEGQLLRRKMNEMFALAKKVFGNHLLRETIFTHAIRQTDGLLDRSAICSLRSVGKDWNDSVCKLLHKNGEALFRIFLGDNNSLNSGDDAEFLNRFMKTFACSSRVLSRSPTYHLALFENVFKEENYESLYNFLIGCGEGLVSIELHLPLNGGAINGILENLRFPSLQTAGFTIDKTRLEGGIRESDNVINFLQSTLNGAVVLKTLTIVHSAPDLYRSSVFENIILPTTLNSINLIEGFSSADLENLLVKNHHPNLTSLSLEMFGTAMKDGLLYGIYENVRGSLKYLCLEDNSKLLLPPSTVQFQFPRMEKLETFKTTSKCCQLPVGIRKLETYLPKLRVLKLDSQSSSDTLDRWINGSRLPTVKELCLDSDDVIFNLNREYLSRIHLAFPNVSKLELDFDQISITGLQYIFMEMTSLEELKIVMGGSGKVFQPIYWDSVLIGIPAKCTESRRALRAKLQINNDEDMSIRKLSDLHSLSLSDHSNEQPEKPLLTDLAFEFAFLKMPQLQKLDLYGNFSVSKGMAAQWRKERRVLNYQRR